MFTGAQHRNETTKPAQFVGPGDLCIVSEGLRTRLACYVRPHVEGRGGWVHIFDPSRGRWQVRERLRTTIRPVTARELARYNAPPVPLRIALASEVG